MCPSLFGIIDSYALMLIIGVIFALFLLFIYFKYKKVSNNFILDLLFTSIVSIFIGVIFACLFENLYEFFENRETYKFTFGMTFYGGLFGGSITFILMYIFFIKKRNGKMMDKILIVAPSSITLAHSLGRIGCFLAGCCYGKETNMWYGIYFPSLEKTVIPTQLYESIFLLILSIIFTIIIFTTDFKYNMIIYLISYSIWRFFIEFLRDDPRGGFVLSMSPSQLRCILLLLLSIPLFFFFKNVIFKKEENK